MTKTTSSLTAISHRPSLTVRDLDLLNYSAKVRHWNREDAWAPSGSRLLFKNPDYRIGNFTLENGNLVQCQPLIGRPCFGIANAFLRYQDHTRYVKGRGAIKAGRCHDCKARKACKWVVEQRLQAHNPLEQAWTEWLKAGGATAFAMPNFKQSHAARCWANLKQELQRHPFTSVNDGHAVKAYEDVDRDAKEQDRKRKQRDRRRARRSGEIDSADIGQLEEAAQMRAGTIYKARLHPSCPKKLARTPWKSLYNLVDAWLGREVMRARKMKPHAPNIARWIVDTNRYNDSKNHAALASRVAKDLDRIACFERLRWEGKPLLPSLDLALEFSSDLDGKKAP